MSTYAELTARLQDTVENSFTADQLAFFFQQAEKRVYQAVQIPALRKQDTGALVIGDNKYALPADFLYVYSIAVVDTDGTYSFLIDKDVNYIREAYPSPTATGTSKFYAIFDESDIILGPTPSAALTVEMQYGYYPESIVSAGTTWLSENYDPVLFNGALLEAARFLKFEQDIVTLYERMYAAALGQLKMFGDGKLRQDAYRSGQPRVGVE
jgi:hypothetical protein